jgi:hypothetical protein
MRPPCGGQIWASQGGLSRNKVAVGESAAGSPPTDRDWGVAPAHIWRVSDHPRRAFDRPSTYELPELTLYGGRAHSSVAERRLCKAEALGSNPSGSMSRTRSNPCPLSGARHSKVVRKTDAPSRANADGKGRCTHPDHGRANETVCTCDPGVHWTRFNEFNVRRELALRAHNIRESVLRTHTS